MCDLTILVLKPEQNSPAIWVDAGKSSNCREYLLRSEPSGNSSLQVTLTSLKYEFFDLKIVNFNWKYPIQNTIFSKLSENICPSPPLVASPITNPRPCYIVKLDAKSKAILLDRKTRPKTFLAIPRHTPSLIALSLHNSAT